jgi:hypothetical protein
LISIKGGWDLPALGCLEGIGPAAATRTVNGVLNLTQKRKFSSTKVDNYRLRSSRFPANISEDVLMSADKDKWIADIPKCGPQGARDCCHATASLRHSTHAQPRPSAEAAAFSSLERYRGRSDLNF